MTQFLSTNSDLQDAYLNSSMVTRIIGADTFTLLYDGSLRMVAVQKNGATIAEFAYDGDGRMVVSAVGGVTTYTVGGYFEWRVDASGSRAVKYYNAGSARVAMRQGDAVTFARPPFWCRSWSG